MTRIVLVQSVLAHNSGIPADSVVNDFVYIVPDSGNVSESANLVMEAITKGFYNSPVGATPVNQFLSATLSRVPNKCQLRFYDITDDLTGTRHGSPYRTHQWTLGGSGSAGGMPSEIAVALSFRADYGTQSEFGPGIGPGGGPLRPRARRRGRLYVGPVTQASSTEETNTKRPYVSNTCRATISGAAKVLMDTPDIEWAVWSRVDGNALKVVEAWVDDAFDVQRRRGEKAIARTTVVAA